MSGKAIVVIALAGLAFAGASFMPAAAARGQPPTSVSAASASVDADGAPVVVRGARQYDVRSKSGQDYRLFLSVPTGEPPAEGFPVLYVTDGNWYFSSAVAAPPLRGTRLAVVGIGYPTDDNRAMIERRYYDMTSPVSEEWLSGPAMPNRPKRVGGQEEFFDFIENEVKPFVAERVKVNAEQETLYGHSLGGIFTLHVLAAHPEAFDGYIAASPSLWWNDGASIAADEATLAKRLSEQPIKARLQLSIGELEQKRERPADPGRAAAVAHREKVGNARELSERLAKLADRGLETTFRVFPEEDHGTHAFSALSRGVRFIASPAPASER